MYVDSIFEILKEIERKFKMLTLSEEFRTENISCYEHLKIRLKNLRALKTHSAEWKNIKTIYKWNKLMNILTKGAKREHIILFFLLLSVKFVNRLRNVNSEVIVKFKFVYLLLAILGIAHTNSPNSVCNFAHSHMYTISTKANNK